MDLICLLLVTLNSDPAVRSGGGEGRFVLSSEGMDNHSAVAVATASPLFLPLGGNGELQIFCDELMPNPSNERRRERL